MDPKISDFMTESPHSIAARQTLAAAHRIMRANRIRHLPVLEHGRLVGIVSERDLHMVETLKDVDPETVYVEDAMTPDAFTVGPGASLRTVAAEMAARRHGSAVVMKGDKVIGIFTTVDALRALAALLQLPGRAQLPGGARRADRARSRAS
jgi:acetoin utilization protein AcuB